MFDLPVVREEDRRNASQFRNDLRKHGFSMSQFSVYTKVVPGKDKAERVMRDVSALTPPAGRVSILAVTDKQYEKIVSIEKGIRDAASEKQEQLTLI